MSGSALLVVNDDPVQLRRIARLLERGGYRVHAVERAGAGLDVLAREGDIAGVVTDLHMPDIDGWRFCRLLRSPEYAEFNRLPILVVSATYSGTEAEELTAELGAHAFLESPFEPDDLRRHVADMLAGRTTPHTLDVLVVHPDDAVRDEVRRAFVGHGYRTRDAATAAAARAEIDRLEPDMVVVDDELPDGRAEEFLDRCKHPGSRMVVVVTTSGGPPERAVALTTDGADAYVRAPYEPRYLVTLCEKARRERALFRVQDILETRTRRLLESEERLATLYGSIHDVVLLHDREGRVLYANPAAAETLGPPSPGAEVSFADGMTEEQRDAWRAHLRAAARSGRAQTELALRHRDGRAFPVDVTSRRTHFGGRAAFLSVARDVSERRRHQEEYRLLATAVHQAAEMLLVSDPDGRIAYVNPAFERITGYTAGDAVGRHIHLLRSDEDGSAGAYADLEAALRAGRTWSGRLRRRRRDGSSFTSEGTVSPVRDASGRLTHYVGLERDVTDKVQLEQAMRQSQKMEAIGTLAGGIAHDFNNQLTSILGYANLIVNIAEDGSEVGKMAGVIETSAERCSQLTRQLLGFARRGKNRDVPVDVHEIIRRVEQLLERTIAKTIRIHRALPAGPAHVRGDPAQLEQALLNLALNGRDAIDREDGGELRFSTGEFEMTPEYCSRHPGTRPGRYLMIAVEDDGCGIPEHVRNHIFEPFFTTKEPGRGTGMGLAMVYGIVKNHQGSIQVYSELGHGTVVRLYLPVAAAAAPEKAAPRERLHLGSGRVLVVDDEETVRSLAVAMLQRLGYEVVTAADGEEAVIYFRAFGADVDLVLMDMMMPNMGGAECYRELKRIDANVRVVLSSGFGLNEAAQKLLDAGVIAFAQKPYRITELSKVIAEALASSASAGVAPRR